MAYVRKFKTDAELKEFRKTQAAKNSVKAALGARGKRAPLCHPERQQVGKTGMCHECYVGAGESKEMTFQDAMKLVEKHADPHVRKVLKDKALALLFESLPEYALLHMQAAKMAAVKGDARPAEWALTTIKEAGGTAVLEPPQKEAAPSGTKVLIAVQLGGISPPDSSSKVVDVSPVHSLVDTSVENP
jgi:hypothetical protein